MSLQGIGDLAQSLQLRRENVRVQGLLRTLSEEIATGRRADLGRTVSGDFGPLAGIERSLKAVTAYRTAATEAKLIADASQSALAFVQDRAASIAPALLISQEDYDETVVNAAAETAARGFEDAIRSLNVRVGDRSVFAGVATDGPALADAETILAELDILVAPETTAAGVEAAVAAWFAPGGGFETTAYLGDPAPLSGLPISENERVSLDVTAADSGIRGTLEGLALAALLDRGALTAQPDERTRLARAAGERLLASDYDIVEARAQVGVAQERVETAQTRNAAQEQSLEIARAEIVAADPYETAVRLREAEVQLETIYTMTARLSRLNLTAFLR